MRGRAPGDVCWQPPTLLQGVDAAPTLACVTDEGSPKQTRVEGPWSPKRLELATTLPVVATVGVALVPIVLSTLKIFSFARGDELLIAVITSTINPKAIVAATLVDVLPLVMLAVGLRLVTRFRWPLPADKFESDGQALGHTIAIASGMLLLLYVALLAPWATAPPVLLVGAFAGILAWRRERDYKKSMQAVRSYFAFGTPMPTLLLLAMIPWVLARGAWLPTELITVEHAQPEVGYVLDATGSYTTIVFRDDQRVARIESAHIKSRDLCRTSRSAANDSLVGIFSPNPTQPCPSPVTP